MPFNRRRLLAYAVGGLLLLPVGAAARAEQLMTRVELARSDLAEAPGMETIVSRLEARPGAVLPLHTHHGDEFLYVLEGGTVQPPGKTAIEMTAGQTLHFPRGLPHGGFTVVGDRTIKAITFHIVDKGKPFAEPAAK